MTLFIDESHLELATGLSLTIMLVMYTLYQSISDSMPQTAYLKWIDVWLMFCLMLPFAIFLFQILSEVVRPKGRFRKKENRWVEEEPRKSSSWRRFSQFAIPGLTIMFVLCYCAVASMYYNYD